MSVRDLLSKYLKEYIPKLKINSSDTDSLPGTLNVTFPEKLAETVLIRLDMKGIFASAGSACSTGAIEPSHVLTAIGLTASEAKRTVRFSIGRENTKEDMITVAEILKEMFSA